MGGRLSGRVRRNQLRTRSSGLLNGLGTNLMVSALAVATIFPRLSIVPCSSSGLRFVFCSHRRRRNLVIFNREDGRGTKMSSGRLQSITSTTAAVSRPVCRNERQLEL